MIESFIAKKHATFLKKIRKIMQQAEEPVTALI